ncbi:hypothetical protein F4809DRAFT_440704 [Biscogniauxia mediterranea]|nr:hypothetical protein F4809DRAFT_440704 [Biscogniauxia mediterranea]
MIDHGPLMYVIVGYRSEENLGITALGPSGRGEEEGEVHQYKKKREKEGENLELLAIPWFSSHLCNQHEEKGKMSVVFCSTWEDVGGWRPIKYRDKLSPLPPGRAIKPFLGTGYHSWKDTQRYIRFDSLVKSLTTRMQPVKSHRAPPSPHGKRKSGRLVYMTYMTYSSSQPHGSAHFTPSFLLADHWPPNCNTTVLVYYGPRHLVSSALRFSQMARQCLRDRQ